MAKRYFSHEELKGQSGFFKPSGTLGKHHCTITPQGEKIVVVGSAEGRVTLKPGDTLGYNCGSVWLVPSPDSYKDPIRRVLAMAHVSQKVLMYSDGHVEYTVSYSSSLRNSAADVETGDRAIVMGDHQDQEVPNTRWDGVDRGEYVGGFSFRKEVTGGDVVVIRSVSSFEPTTSSRSRRTTRVVVRTTTDKNSVTKWLEKFFDVGSAREARIFRETLKERQFADDLTKAKELLQVLAGRFDKSAFMGFMQVFATFPPQNEAPKNLGDSIRSFFNFDWGYQTPQSVEEAFVRVTLMMSDISERDVWYLEPCEDSEAAVVTNGLGFRVSTRGSYLPSDICEMFWDHKSAMAAIHHQNETLVGLLRTERLQSWIEKYR